MSIESKGPQDHPLFRVNALVRVGGSRCGRILAFERIDNTYFYHMEYLNYAPNTVAETELTEINANWDDSCVIDFAELRKQINWLAAQSGAESQGVLTFMEYLYDQFIACKGVVVLPVCNDTFEHCASHGGPVTLPPYTLTVDDRVQE